VANHGPGGGQFHLHEAAEPWLGEVEALELNLVHIAEKLAQVERAEARQPQVTGELLAVPAPAVAE
jgi:hypothetical protein